MIKAFLTWYVISISVSTILPWTPLPPSYSFNIFPEFPIRMWYVDAAKVSRINYNDDNKDGISESFIIRSDENIQIGQLGKPNY